MKGTEMRAKRKYDLALQYANNYAETVSKEEAIQRLRGIAYVLSNDEDITQEEFKAIMEQIKEKEQKWSAENEQV